VNDPGQNRQMHYQYQYDKVGNITGKATEHGAYVYQYDDLYRLIEAQNPNSDTETFTYDPVGNRLTTQASPTPWIYNANHALQSRPEAIGYGYDANGSTTQITREGQTTQLIYNAANRLAEIKDHANQSVATYRYDPFGRRISKTVHGDTTYFLYSPQGLIGEYTATGSLIRGYGYKPGGHWMTDPLYLKTGNAREQHYFYQNDHLGTPQKLMSTTGAIVWDARYEAFGQATPIPLLPGVQPIDNPLRFAGQYHDPETGWHYNWHRYYAPELGRYITEDPIGLQGGLNTYAYVGGNPLKYWDSVGLRKSQINIYFNFKELDLTQDVKDEIMRIFQECFEKCEDNKCENANNELIINWILTDVEYTEKEKLKKLDLGENSDNFNMFAQDSLNYGKACGYYDDDKIYLNPRNVNMHGGSQYMANCMAHEIGTHGISRDWRGSKWGFGIGHYYDGSNYIDDRVVPKGPSDGFSDKICNDICRNLGSGGVE
jgi:RHS repeat-associated protein